MILISFFIIKKGVDESDDYTFIEGLSTKTKSSKTSKTSVSALTSVLSSKLSKGLKTSHFLNLCMHAHFQNTEMIVKE